MGKSVDLTGRTYGHLVVEGLSSKRTKNGTKVWNCLCSCGRQTLVPTSLLNSGNTKSCGGRNHGRVAKHGKSKSRTYAIWSAMHTRCKNPKVGGWHRYGGRGISVCERWSDFRRFYEDMGDPPKGTSLDRIDNDGNYEPQNCRWATHAQQNMNKSTTANIEYNGTSRHISEWSKIVGLSVSALTRRKKAGLSGGEILFGTRRGFRRRKLSKPLT